MIRILIAFTTINLATTSQTHVRLTQRERPAIARCRHRVTNRVRVRTGIGDEPNLLKTT